MNKQEIRNKLIQMGFYISNKGFNYIVEALSFIHENGYNINTGEINKIIAELYNTSSCAVERASRHEINQYYEVGRCHPALFNKNKPNGRYSSKEFLFRLHEIVYGEWA